MKDELVSILMPAYNCENYIRMAIDSILEQTHVNFELLIADDLSTDKTKAIIDGYSDNRIIRFHNEQNLGYLRTTNKLFERCKGKFITFQDADDYSEPNRIEGLLDVFNTDVGIGCCYSNVYIVNENGKIERRTNFPNRHDEIYTGILKGVVFCGAAIMIRSDILNEVGYYDEYFDRLGNEDKQWFGRILERTNVFCIEKPLYFYRMNQYSVSRNRTNLKAFVSEDVAKLSIQYFRMFKKDILNDPLLSGRLNQYERERLAIYRMKNESFFFSLKIFVELLLRFKFSMEFFREGLSLLKYLAISSNKRNESEFNK